MGGAAGASASGSAPGTAATQVDNGSVGLRLVDVPVSAKDDPRARSYVIDHLAPGTVIERRVEVSNTTSSTTHVVLYPAAATIVDDSFLGSEGHTPNDLSTWTSVDPGTSEVPAGGLATATVTIAVPKDAPPGEQYGVVWAEVSSAPNDAGVTTVNRVGIRLYIHVGPGSAPAADFTIDSLTAERSADGDPVVRANVTNTGGRALDMSGTLTLGNGPGGLSAGPFDATLGSTLAVGATGPVMIVLDDRLPAGPWDASITLRSGLVERTASATITFPDVGAAAAVPTDSPLPLWLVPLVVATTLMLLILVGLVVALRRRRRRQDQADQAPEPVSELITTGNR